MKFKFTIDASTETGETRTKLATQRALLVTTGGYDTPENQASYTYEDRTYTFSPASAERQPSVLVTSGKGARALPQATYVYDTDANKIVTGEEAKPNVRQRTTLDSPVNVAQVLVALNELVTMIGDEFDTAPASYTGKLEVVKDDLTDYFSLGFKRNEVPISYDGITDPPKPDSVSEDADIQKIVNGEINPVRAVSDLIDELSVANTDFGLFVAQGNKSALKGANEASSKELNTLYDNFTDMVVDYLGVNPDSVDQIASDVEAALKEPDQPEEETVAADVKEEPTPSYDTDKAKRQIVDTLKKLMSEKPEDDALKKLYEESDFAPGKALNVEINSQITRIETSEELNPDSPVKLANNDLTKLPVHLVNAGVFKVLKKKAPKRLKTELELPQNSDALALLRAGKDDTDALGEEGKKLYNNCVKFADYIGIKKSFLDLIGEAQASDDEEEEEQTEPEEETDDPAAEEETDDPDEGEGKKKKEPAEDEDEEDEDEDEEPAEKVEEPQPGFFVNIKGVNQDQPVEVKLTFNKDNEQAEAPVKKIPTSSFGKDWAYMIDDSNRELFKKYKGYTAEISVSAFSKQENRIVTKTDNVRIQYPPPKGISVPTIAFIFSRGLTAVNDRGTKADVGQGGAKNFTGRGGDVQEVFYTGEGGVGTALLDTNVDAVGKTYRFTFKTRPFLVPVELVVSGKSPLNEATVPHWIFIKAGDTARGTGGGGGGAGGGGQGGSGTGDGSRKIKVNIAIEAVRIKTDEKWIVLPNNLNPWDKDTYQVNIFEGSGTDIPDLPASAKPVWGMSDIEQNRVKVDYVKGQIYQALFRTSPAWLSMGLDAWWKDRTVTGGSAVTARDTTQNVAMGG